MANFPLIRAAFGLDPAPSGGPEGGTSLAVATTELINDYTGPVVLFDGAGAVQMANGLAKPIISALAGGPGATLRGMLDDALKGGGVASKRLNLPIPTGDGVFDVTLLPEGAGEGETPSRVLLLARDSTFDVNFGRALVASRQLFKDLVACSADFVWETDADGCFTFVSGRGLLGYTPDELDGRPARDLLADGEDHDASEAALNPFEILSHLDEVECWLLDRD
ncbi:MAG: PAS domain S-box protein, partial [Rhodospirillaceae bacterium]|nr:PAS domain S-box protein [Rhodospirillaceae bacterium]